MSQTRVVLAADTWTELDPAVYGQQFTFLTDLADVVVQLVSDGTAPGTDTGDAVTAGESVQVILAQDFAGSVWVKSTAGGLILVNSYGPGMVLVGETAAGT